MQYKVKDMTQADFGRLEIDLAEAEMPGLMACRTEFGASQPFKGAKIAGATVRNVAGYLTFASILSTCVMKFSIEACCTCATNCFKCTTFNGRKCSKSHWLASLYMQGLST